MAKPRGGLTRRLADEPPAADVLAALPVAVLLIDPEDHVCNANTAAEALLNRSQTSMIGLPVGEVLALPDLAVMARRERDHGVWAFDVDLALGQGRVRVDFADAPLADHPGWRMLSIHTLSSPHRSGHGGERSGGALAAVGAAAILAHEIKNPLSGIRGAAQLLAGAGTPLDPDGRGLTHLITREVDRIAALIDGMQQFGDARPLALEPLNIYPMLEHVRELARAGFASHVRIVEDYDPSLPPVLLHRDSFVQVMLNLLKNASEALAGRRDGKVTISTAYRHGIAVNSRRAGERRALPIEIAISDNGPGAPEAIADHLFDPFVSGSKTGQGLGLTLVDKLVRDMGGLVSYSREGSPRSTVFRLRLGRGDGG